MAIQKLFEPGQIVFTPGAVELLQQPGVDFRRLLVRHLTGDWGDCCEADKKENNFSVSRQLRIWSIYHINGEKIYIITEADRSSTCFLTPDEY